MFFGCAKDNVLENTPKIANTSQENNILPYTVSKVNYKELSSNTDLMEKLDAIQHAPNTHGSTSAAKMVYLSKYNFYVDTDQANYVESLDNTYHSYTFPIYTLGNEQNGKPQNLLFSYNAESDTYDTFIATYWLSPEEIEDMANNISVNLEGKVSLEYLKDFDPETVFNSLVVSINVVSGKIGCYEEISGTSQGTGWEIMSWAEVDCPFGTGGGGGSGGGSTGGSGGTGGYDDSPGGFENPDTYDPYSGSPVGGGGTSGGSNDNSLPEPPEIVLSPNISDYYSFLSELSPEEKGWLQNHKYFRKRVETFLEANDYSPESVAFAEEAIEADMNDGEVYFDEIIINELTGKAKCVYNKLNQNGTSFADAIKKFDGKFPVVHLRFAMDYNLPNSTNAVTDNDYQYLIEIRINGNTLNGRTSLGLARTLAHETIHAELFRKVRSVGGTISINDFPGIYDYYRRYVKGWQHQQMAAHYRETIVDILKEFDNNSHSDQFYNDLAWVGLQGTMAWNNLSDSEQQNIINTVVNYKKNGNKTCN